jgi:lipoprotein NlpD
MTWQAFWARRMGRRGVAVSAAVRRMVSGVAVALALAFAGCSSRGPAPVDVWDWKGPVPKGYYLVRRGDTLSRIAQRKRIRLSKLARWNNLRPPYTVYAGKLIRISPSGRTSSSSRSASAKRSGRKVAATRASPKKPRTSARQQTAVLKRDTAGGAPGSRRTASGVPWAWPISGPVRQGFRGSDRTRQGVRIGCRPGQAVKASAAGRVVYSGSGLKGYGNLIIVKHNDKYLSAYGFNRRLFAREGDKVERGQTVAECGQGPEAAYLLHFEVRRHGTPVDPILYLPSRG